MTLEGRKVMKEGWLTLFKSRKTGIFNSKPAPNKQLERGWAVIYTTSHPSKVPSILFFIDNRKEKSVMKREKIELSGVRGVSRMFNHPKHPYCFTLKMKGSKQLILNADSAHDLDIWLRVVCEITRQEYQREKVIWEYYDGGLWNALSDQDSYQIEHHYCDGVNTFQLEDANSAFGYNLNHMNRLHLRTRALHRIKRTPFSEDRPEVYHSKMTDLPALWEWGEEDRDLWHPFERETNIQIEDMYDSGSQWAELTLCMPSPMPFLLDLHDMKLVNFRTAGRFNLRRIDNSENCHGDPTCPVARSPSPDEMETPPQPNMMSPMSPLFRPLQDCLKHLQVPRTSINCKNMLGEGAFGEVFLSLVSGLPGFGDKPAEVAVKQLRLSDFIARHGHHTQQMEDFLREAKEMSKVDNHRVVKLIAVCTLDYPLLLIEEYMNQGDLLGVLKDSRPSMPLLTQLTFAQHVADGMDYIAETLNTVHRDLAARNILVHKNSDGNMQAKVADFGLSRHLYSEMYKTQGSKPRPLPAKWMALESLMYFIFTSKSDVWSYGVMLWEIMTLGRTPYPGVENRELLEQIEEKGLKLTVPKPCPAAIYTMILDCTQHEPDDRPNFSELRTRVETCLEQLEKGELESAADTPPLVRPQDAAAEGGESSTKGKEGEEAETKEVNVEEVKVKEEDKKAGGVVDFDESVEVVAGHLYSTVNKEDVKVKAKAGDFDESVEMVAGHLYSTVSKVTRPTKSSAVSSSEVNGEAESTKTTPPSGDGLVPPSEEPEASGGTVRVNGDVSIGVVKADEEPASSKSDHEVTEMGHLYYLLDPSDKRSPSSSPSRSHSHSSSPAPPSQSTIPNHKPASASASPAHQSSDTAIVHSSPVLSAQSKRSYTHSGGSRSPRTGQEGKNKKKTGSLGRSKR